MAGTLVPEQRVAHCLWTPTGASSSVDVVLRGGEARFQGLQTCGSVWACAFCAARINEVRRWELHGLQDWAKARGYVVLLLTLTARHHEGTNLSWLLAGMRDAKRKLRQSRVWRALKDGPLRGTVTALEVTHGENGWHPHFHELLVLDVGEAAAIEAVEALRGEWLHSLGKVGLSGAGAAFDVRDGSQASRYVAKFGDDDPTVLDDPSPGGEPSRGGYGLPEEMTMSRMKRGRQGGRSPLQLLRDAYAGDGEAARLWAIYARAFRGKRQLTWSDGLKDAVELAEVGDEEAAASEPFDPAEDELVARIPIPVWKHMRHHYRAEILDAAEDGGAEAVHRLLGLYARPPPE